MKRHITSLSLIATLGLSANAQVWINEFIANVPGADTGNEFFELRGTPGMSLAGYYLLSLEGQGTTGRGDVNQFFDLGTYSIGVNGFLFAQQYSSPYTPAVGASVLQNTMPTGWGTNGNNTASYFGDGSPNNQVDLENSATTILLIKNDGGAVPTLTTDLDSNNDGQLELPTGWSVADSVGLLDGVSAGATDFSYGAITFRVGTTGGSAYGNVIDVPGASGSLYVARRGDTTGSSANDWFGAILSGSSGNYVVTANSTDPGYGNTPISGMIPGGTNPVPEPGTLAFLSLGALALLLGRRNR